MIEIIELHLSNLCTAQCAVCSKAHGGNNLHFAKTQVLTEVIRQIKDLGISPTIQFGGDGDAFLYPSFMDTLRIFRDELPDCHRCLYSNGFMLTQDFASEIIGERLLNQLEIRIDSLDPEVYELATGLPLERVLKNIEFFAKYNDYTATCVLHLPLFKYRSLCNKILNKEPTYFDRLGDIQLKDEWPDIQRYFGGFEGKIGVRTRITGISLWAERTDCEFSDYKCPRLPDSWPGDMARQIYVYPNGDLGFCGYDDAQCAFIMGNILSDKMSDVWEGQKAHGFMEQVRSRTSEEHSYCCVNPKACVMWEFDNRGEPINPEVLHG